MANSRKRKTRNSRSRFGLWIPNKVLILDMDSQPAASDSTGSTDSVVGNNQVNKDGVRGRFRRSGSRLLSLLGSRSTPESPDRRSIHDDAPLQLIGEGEESPAESDSPSETSANVLDKSQLPKNSSSRLPQTLANNVESPGCSAPSKSSKDDQNGQENIKRSQTHDQLDVVSRKEKRSDVRRSQSTPGLSDRLSHRLSTTFGHPTVVHRASFRSRPNISSIKSPPNSPEPTINGGNQPDSSDPSTTTPSGSGSSPLSPSTNPTSEGIAPIPLEKSKRSSNIKSLSLWNREASGSKLKPIDEKPVPAPSIVTVEATATAKIFFETHFNSILSGVCPRSQRLRELEEQLYFMPMTPEEKLRTRQGWIMHESEHLRQSRVLKTQAACLKGGKGVSIAGYEVIKVLGKGSFGVVRLVKEKITDQDVPSSSTDNRPSSRNDLSNIKANAIGALKSAVDGTRSSRRKDLSKMKREVFAMKVIRKSDMLRNSQEGHLRAERDFLVASEKSRWIVPLIASFQDNNNLYLVMDYMVGGDFLGLLIRKNTLSGDVTRWYVAEMILCLEEAHRLRWIHRDVKPDNFLIDASGHLKISDFGLAFDGHWSHNQAYFNNHRHSLLKKLGIRIEGDTQDREEEAKAAAAAAEASNPPAQECEEHHIQETEPGPNQCVLQWRNRKEKRRLAKSVVGTSQYMAPEVIRGDPYDGRCDWWSIGVILYECLYGFTPFACENRQETKIKILQHMRSLHFPVDRPSERLIPADAVDLISQLLQEKEYRLCSRKYMLNDYVHSKRLPGELLNRPADRRSKDYQGYYVYPDDAEDIKAHPFFRGIRWNEIHLRKPPFVPKVKSWEDTKYFDEDEPISDVDDVSTDASAEDPPDELGKTLAPPNQLPMADGPGADAVLQGPNAAEATPETTIEPIAQKPNGKTHRKKKEKKRPRDKILRDEEVGKKVLDIRKKGAFLGYTYRRPKGLLIELENEKAVPTFANRKGLD
ncbi:hypothetical protein FQN54_007812 [Arachnomyces sp. PD_36]|nr:hypothetical protein FQN54_007812 [Arachnomyces sp. PD_36]